MVSYISKDEFLQRNPDAINLPKYLKELFEFRDSEPRKIINLKPTQKQNILAEKEKDIQKSLNLIECGEI